MRVLHLTAGNLYGGVERIVLECAASRACCPSLTPSFAVSFDGRLAQEIEATGVGCRRLGDARMSRPHTVLRARRELSRLLDADRVDAVLCHSSWMYGLAAPVVRSRGRGLSIWIHDAVSGRPWVERWARLTPPDVVVSNSRYTDASVPALFPSTPRAVLYAPLSGGPSPAEESRTRLRAALGVDGGTPVVILASRFEAWKGHEALIDAVAGLPGPWRVWIAGRPQRDGEDAYERSLRERVRARGIESRVAFLGERRDVPALMRAADIHCQPNTAPEPFGLAFVEALAAGLPVVTTAIGGALEIVTADCGVLVERGDSAHLASALGALVADAEARRRLGRAGPARARALCDPARQLEALAGILAGIGTARVSA
jgi:glycosyltransferase involved in cell wall biosynthesis